MAGIGEVAEVAAVLRGGPARTAAEIRAALQGQGRVSVTTADVERVLASALGRFCAAGGDPQRWQLIAGGQPEQADRGHEGHAGDPVDSDRRHSQLWRGPTLYAWQEEALDAWRRQAGRGVVEAVTGTGKTMVGVVAAHDELASGGQVCVLVPTRELLVQWRAVLRDHLPSSTSVGLLGGGYHDRLGDHDVLVAVVNSARLAEMAPRRPGSLLVADECHRFATLGNRVALETGFARRLGLSATYARADDGHLAWLDPYFGGTCYRLGYGRALADGVTARFRVALVGVAFSAAEQADYDELSQLMSTAKAKLLSSGLVDAKSVGAFFESVSRLAKGGGDDDSASTVARRYLWAVQERRALLAETPAKSTVLSALAPAVRAADRAIIFTQSIAAADRAAADLTAQGLRAGAVHSGQPTSERRAVLAGFASGAFQAVAAPQVLDEGVDVPAADLALITGASRSRRQMVQRMGRVLRRKPDGRLARFVIMFVEGTVEDPATGAHEGFLDEVTPVADDVVRFHCGTPSEDICAYVDRRW